MASKRFFGTASLAASMVGAVVGWASCSPSSAGTLGAGTFTYDCSGGADIACGIGLRDLGDAPIAVGASFGLSFEVNPDYRPGGEGGAPDETGAGGGLYAGGGGGSGTDETDTDADADTGTDTYEDYAPIVTIEVRSGPAEGGGGVFTFVDAGPALFVARDTGEDAEDLDSIELWGEHLGGLELKAGTGSESELVPAGTTFIVDEGKVVQVDGRGTSESGEALWGAMDYAASSDDDAIASVSYGAFSTFEIEAKAPGETVVHFTVRVGDVEIPVDVPVVVEAAPEPPPKP